MKQMQVVQRFEDNSRIEASVSDENGIRTLAVYCAELQREYVLKTTSDSPHDFRFAQLLAQGEITIESVRNLEKEEML